MNFYSLKVKQRIEYILDLIEKINWNRYDMVFEKNKENNKFFWNKKNPYKLGDTLETRDKLKILFSKLNELELDSQAFKKVLPYQLMLQYYQNLYPLVDLTNSQYHSQYIIRYHLLSLNDLLKKEK